MTQTAEYRRILTRMGYYNYQNGLLSRHVNQEGGWDEHLQLCRNYILKILDLLKPETITILGSGWLLDLPLPEMLEKTEKIFLVDIVHPPEVVKQISIFEKIKLLEADITGGLINEVWGKTRKHSIFNKLKDLSEINIPDYAPDFDPGMVVSLNILTQLENLPLEFLKRKAKISAEKLNLFRAEVQKRHIDFLKKHKSILISDFEEIYIDRKENMKHVPTILTDIPAGIQKEEWTWNFDLKGVDFNNSRSLMNVIAVTFNL